MRKLHRGMTAAALSAPLLLGVTGVAAADEFEQSASSVGPNGASTSQVQTSAGSNGDGQVSFEESQASAGPDGASSSSTEANTGGDGDGLLGGSEDEGLLGLGILG